MIKVQAYVYADISVVYTMCFQVPLGFLSRPKMRSNRVLCVLKNASNSRDPSREKHFCLWNP